MTIYEEVHPQKHYANNGIHTHFLRKLCAILPVDCRPIVVTDAGFRNTWFTLITQLGWDFIGRVKFQTLIKIGDNDWPPVKSLYPKATTIPKYLSQATIARKNPLNAVLYIYKEQSKGRIKKTIQGDKCQSSNSKKYTRGANEPWIIITSLPEGLNTAKKVIMSKNRVYVRTRPIANVFLIYISLIFCASNHNKEEGQWILIWTKRLNWAYVLIVSIIYDAFIIFFQRLTKDLLILKFQKINLF